MKKYLALILSLAMTFVLVACGGSPEVTKEATSVTSGGETVSSNSTTPTDSTTSTPATTSTSETVEEQVLLDESGFKITLKSLDKGGVFGPEFKMLFENESGKDVTVQANNVSVNGYMIDNMMSVDIANGKKANDSLTLSRTALETAGISTIADCEFSFHIFDSGSWNDILNSAPVTIKTSAADGYTYTFDDSGHVAYEGNDLKIVIKGLAENSNIIGPSIVVYVENNSSKDITAQVRNISINGFMVDAIFSSDVKAGKHCIDTITFMNNDLEKNDIATIENVELSFHVFDMNSWNDIVDTDPITINF